MENKSNSLNRIKRHQREKVLRFSIRKYSFGAASVAVAALMFLGARVASADSVIENHSQPTTDVVNQKEKDKPLVEIQQSTDNKVEVAQNPSEKKMTTNNESVVKVVDKAKLKKVVEELNTTLSSKSDLDKSVISPIKDRVQKGQALLDSDTATQKDVDELLSLLESDLTVLSNATKESSKVQENATENKTEIKDNKSTSELSEADKTISDKKESLKLSAEQLQAAVLELPEHESTKEVFEKANELLGLAQGVIENTTISPNDVEDMTKRVKRMFNSVKISTLRLTSGSHDPRNGKSMAQGTNFRATTVEYGRVENALINVKEFISEARGQGSTENGNRDRTIQKTFMTAKYSEENGAKYITYDVYFQNDGRALDGATRNALWFYPPRDILYSDGSYPKGPVYEAYYERYRNNTGTGTLSHNPNNFTKVGDTYNVPLRNGQYEDSSSQRLWGESYSFFQLTAGPTRDNQRQEMLKNLKDNPELNSIIKQNNSYPGASYSHLLSIGANVNYAYKYHVKLRLKNNVTADEAKRAGVMAVTTKSGLASNATAAYIYAATGSRLVTKPDAQVYPIQGSTHTKTVGDSIPNSGNPVADRYITRKGSGDFPAGMSWSWEGNNSPSTVNAGKFTYTAIARYQDGTTSKDANSGSDGRVYFTVNPKKPTITTSVVNKKGLTNQTIEVNVGSGVKNGSVVKLYDGNRVIGQGTSNGTTARITVSGALPGNPLKAETTVDNGGVVVSEKSDPVTPTEAPDTQAPTLTITPANQTVVEGQTVTFTVTARDNKHVNLDANDFLTKYGTRVFSGKASITSPTDTDTEKTRRITITTTAEDVGKTNTITFNATDNANHRATPVSFTFTVTSRDKIAPTITAGNATVTSREQITPISVTAEDNRGGVGMRDNNPIEVTGLPSGLTYANNQITGTPTGSAGNTTVTIKAYDRNNRLTTKTITITVRSQADVHNPTGAGLTVNQNHTITDAELKAKVSNYAPGSLSIVSRPSTATAGNAGNAVVKVTYPDGTFDNVNVPVTVTDVTGPTITANNATVTSREQITPIPVTAVDNTGGVGMRQNNPIEVTGLPSGLTYANNQITGTPTGPAGNSTVTIKAYDRNNRLTTKTITITVRSQADVHNPTGETLTVPYNHNITDDEVKAKVQNFAPGTLTVQSKPSTNTSGNVGNAVVIVTYPDGSQEPVNVNVTVLEKLTGTVTNPGKVKEKAQVPPTKVVTPNKPGSTITTETPVNGLTVDGDGNLTGTPTVPSWGDDEERKVTIPVKVKNGDDEVTVEVPVTIQRDTDGDGDPDVTDKDDDNDGIPDETEKTNGTDPKVADKLTGTVTNPGKVKEKAQVPPTKVVTPNKPGSTITTETPVNGLTVDGDGNLTGTPTVPSWGDDEERKVTIPVKVKNGDDEVTVEVPVTIQRDTDGDGDPDVTDKDDDNDGIPDETEKTNGTDPKVADTLKPLEVEIIRKPNGNAIVTPKKPDGTTYPSGSKVEIPGENGTTITVTIGDNGSGEVPNDNLPKKDVPGTGTVTEPNKKPSQPVDVTTPARKTPTVDVEQDPKTGDVTVTPKRPDGSTYPPGTTVEIPGKDGNPITVTIGEDGKGKVPNSELPEGKVPGTAKITEPGKPAVEVPNVTTPAHKTPTVDVEQDPKTGDVTVTPKRPDGSTYPPGTTVEIPGKDGNPITVTIGEDGKGKVPNSELPEGKVPGTGKITEPGKPVVEVPNVTTPAHKTPTVDVEQDPKTGDVTVTPKRPDGSTYPPGTTVEIPGKDGNPITVTIGEDGKGKVPNSELPEGKVPGTGKITEPGKPAMEVPNVTTPAHKTPTVDVEQDPKTGDVTVTPKRPDGSTYPPGTTVEIPGKDGNPITVTIGEDGKGKVPNSELPEGKVPGTAKITEPGKPAVEVPNVTTPAHKTPTVDVEQDPKTGEVTVTPKKPDGSTFPPGTTVEIPGENGPITVEIGQDGKGKVPNDKLPKKDVPGTAKITEPGKPAVEVPNVTTPGKFTPETPVTEKPGKIEITQQPNGNAIVTPKKPDGTTYPSGSKVEIPGENGTTIIVTIGDNGSGEVPNDNLPKTNVPGTGTVTEPNKKPSQPVDVTTPARKTPTVDVEQDPKTGDVTVTPKKPDGSTYPPGTKVEIPGKDGNPITVTIGEEGKGKVPNSELPDGKVPGTGKITEPGKPAVEVPVETPAKVTPATPTDTIPVAPVTPDTPVKPDTNGGSGQDTPAPSPTTPTTDAVTPNADQVDTKTTNDNGAKSNDSQNVLPNTGTESNAALASLGLLGLLSGFGLVARKKKED
ncbi:LPXTG-motif cell wall anchor domain protein [Streptococcus mitis]|uniref:LPXTG-motif cell wall anchor domain protein n=1 Tax=Streptococcus mitis TaxID=28037 RepID=A0A081PZI7_STRMT|nr:YSIRK signal domain/LPXTG anchor domain surface protein [Streptococcus mitis]KEQ36110.1 LPXTG-motif cell wall anchor domain protein [Streptococcus mitis]